MGVDERTAGDDRDDTVGVVMLPPDENGAALISLVKHDEEMTDGLKNASTVLAALLRRLVRAHLLYVEPALLCDPLASIAYDDNV